jgi:hypothetical protein
MTQSDAPVARSPRWGAKGDPGRREIRRAWWSLALIPVGYLIAYAVGTGILSVLGYADIGDELPPLHASVLAGVPATVFAAAPGLAALWFGSRAHRLRRPGGLVPGLLGALFAGYMVLVTGVNLLVGR